MGISALCSLSDTQQQHQHQREINIKISNKDAYESHQGPSHLGELVFVVILLQGENECTEACIVRHLSLNG